MTLHASSKSSNHLKSKLPRDVTQVMPHELLGAVSGGRHTEQGQEYEWEHLTVTSGIGFLGRPEAWGQCQFSLKFALLKEHSRTNGER